MTIKEKILQDFHKAIKQATGVERVPAYTLDRPANEEHGDYALNVALVLARQTKKNPMTLANAIVAAVPKHEYIDRLEVVVPGFINIWLSSSYLLDSVKQAMEQKEQFGFSHLSKRNVVVEFTDPNPFKEFHVGHLYSNVVGESICRLLASQGDTVHRVCYQGDVGLHVAKAIWGIKNEELRMKNVEGESLEEKAKFLGEAYAKGASAYEESEQAKEEINSLNKKIYEQDPSIIEYYKKGRTWSLAYFEEIYKRLGTKFERYYFESEAGRRGLDLVKRHIKDGVFEESEGAVIFPGEKQGLHNRVFINSIGLPTYEAKELGLAPTKFEDFAYDLSIIITGNEITEYFKVLLKALSLIYPQLAQKTKHLGHGMVRLPQGKMSSRTGDIVTGEWLLDETKKRLSKAFPDITQDILEQIAIGAVKFAFLKHRLGKDIIFSFEESVSLEGNSGPYVQYTYARTQSVVQKFQISNSKSQINTKYKILNTKYHFEPEESLLLRYLYRFPEVVSEAATNYAPHMLTEYLFELSQRFNLFYQKQQIIGSKEEEFRLSLTQAVGQVLQNGLHLLGIKTPQRI